MLTYFRLLAESGMRKSHAFLTLVRCSCSLKSRSRQERWRIALMQRKEVCEAKDAIVVFMKTYTERRSTSDDYVSMSQLENVFPNNMGLVARKAALRELLRDGYLTAVPAGLREAVYALTPRRYISKTVSLTTALANAGYYAKAVNEHEPYRGPQEYDV